MFLRPENHWLLPPSAIAYLLPKLGPIPPDAQRPRPSLLSHLSHSLFSPCPPSLPSPPCTPELHPGSAVLQEESLGLETQVGRVMEENPPDQEPLQNDKDKGLVEEVGLGGGGVVEEVFPPPSP